MLLSKFLTRRKEARSLGTVAINFRPIDNSYGGMNVFVQQISRWLEDRGYQVIYELRQDIDIIFIVHPWMTHTEPFGFEEVKRFKQSNPKVNVLLRVNECDKRKNTNHMDGWLAQWESISDHTYFISQWLRDYHAKRWFDVSRPHSAIYNGADPRIFHPIGSAPYESDKPLRIVTHHWSDNPMKGYADYEKLDAMIASNVLTNVEFLVIGRWPADIKWRATTTHGPAHGKTLANLLRSCHVYLTGSQWEPCGMHHVEGLQCGLPVIYHRDGGGIVERAKKYGVEYTDNVCLGIQEMRLKYSEYRHKVLHDPPASGDQMCLRAVDIVQKLRLA